MNAKQKKFITEKLIPFILREQGRGFGMSRWGAAVKLPVGSNVGVDGIYRDVPVCGSVACIGGSVDLLKPPGTGNRIGDDLRIAEILGLTERQADTLFYGWEGNWPTKFKQSYAKRKTPLGKAKVAVALLQEVVNTNGAILGETA